jgi:hypothetical protein
MYVINASSNATTWFSNPNLLGEYPKFEFTRRLLLLSDPQAFIPDKGLTVSGDTLKYFIETVIPVQGKVSNPDGTLGISEPNGKFFEDLVRELESSQPPDWTTQVGESPLDFIHRSFGKLLELATNVTYVDQWALAGCVSNKLELLNEILKLAPSANLRIVSGTQTGVGSEQSFYSEEQLALAKRNLRSMVSRSSFRGSLDFNFASWKGQGKPRYMILSFRGGAKIAIEKFNLSLNGWGKPFESEDIFHVRKYSAEIQPLYSLATGQCKVEGASSFVIRR